ncbi:MAG: TlpA family protein disulfide reductase [Chthoniobacterales bacterium]
MNTATVLRRRLGSLGLGVLILGAVYGFAFFLSSDLRLIYALGAILLFSCATWLGAKAKRDWLIVALLSLPLLAGFGLLVLVKMPVLWPHLLFWLIAAIIGFCLLGAAGPRRLFSICAACLFVGASLWYCRVYLPKRVARSLTHFPNAAAPMFALQPVSDGPVPTGPIAGKVLVIDFFSTTCGPCIAELPELARARDELRDKGDIEFVVVASDAGGDTPERFKSFIERRRVPLPLAFDSGGKAHAAFGFTGVPALVVLDKTGRVRLTHEGYNASEMNFRRDLVGFLKAL